MKRIALTLSLLVPALALGETSTWTFDSSHTATTFSVKHLVISTVRGQFGKTEGTITLDEGDVTRSAVQSTVDVSTIDTRVAARDADLRSPTFFDAAQYPTMTFRSTKVEKAANDKLKVTGDLTVKGTTKPATFDVTITNPIKGARGESRIGFEATTRIDRKAFGLNYAKTVEAGPVVGDEVTVVVEGEAIQSTPRGPTS